MPFSELGELSGVPNQPQAGPGPLPSAPQLKAKSALGAFAAQRVAGLAQPALHLVDHALAAGRRGAETALGPCCCAVHLQSLIVHSCSVLSCGMLGAWVLHQHRPQCVLGYTHVTHSIFHPLCLATDATSFTMGVTTQLLCSAQLLHKPAFNTECQHP